MAFFSREKVRQGVCPSQWHIIFKSSGCAGSQRADTGDNSKFIALQHGQ